MPRITPFGISALSKSNNAAAYNGEVMCNKMTGEIAVKTPKGDTVSYNYFSRLRTTIDDLTQSSAAYGLRGNIYTIKPDNISLPVVIDNTFEPISADFLYKDMKSIIFAVNVDGIINASNLIDKTVIDMVYADYTLTIKTSDNGSTSITKHIPVQDMINDHITLPKNTTSINISDFNISVDTSITDTHTVILNNMLIFIEE